MPITTLNVLIQRDGRMWLMPERILLGEVHRERRGRTPNAGWQAKCERCSPWWTPIRKTRRDAVLDLIDHWNEGELTAQDAAPEGH